jgi:hypothetical protein
MLYTSLSAIGEYRECVARNPPHLVFSRIEACGKYVARKQNLCARRCNGFVNRYEIDAAPGQTVTACRDDVSHVTGLSQLGEHLTDDRPPFKPVSAATLNVFAHDVRVQFVGGLLARRALCGYLRFGCRLLIRPDVPGADKYDGLLVFTHFVLLSF